MKTAAAIKECQSRIELFAGLEDKAACEDYRRGYRVARNRMEALLGKLARRAAR